ncbi:anti-sigma factor antagonist [Flammeovirga pectinis]|uniref:Anti-sigma factor antagonist n=1 Tax=Flammeovirga pectinis TaxID=2494373 RepID=A0A3Q9FQG6_9BACT|nr:STAS domain-containing protein [Flammeovirga pectinis]AZQ64053.1 anti-sigma factor antagonist [Flammeovirga pectinis]
MEIDIQNTDNITVINVNGYLDANTSPVLDQKIADLVAEGNANILLNLKDVGYMSSSGLRVFLNASKAVRPLRGKFKVCQVTPDVMEVIKMTGFDIIVDVIETYDAAISSY